MICCIPQHHQPLLRFAPPPEVYFHASYEVHPSISYDIFHLVSHECYIQTLYCRSGINEFLIYDGWDNSIMSRYYAIPSSMSIHNLHEICEPNTCHPYDLSDFPYIFMVSVQLGLNICHFPWECSAVNDLSGSCIS